jgi:acylphosphatase
VIRRRLIISGDVQGVFFRDATRERASSAGVAGWARNREDGTVEVALEGSHEGVEYVERFCRSGPRRARVDSVDTFDEEPEGLSGFEIR